MTDYQRGCVDTATRILENELVGTANRWRTPAMTECEKIIAENTPKKSDAETFYEKYEQAFACGFVLSLTSAATALGKCLCFVPKLYVHPEQYGTAILLRNQLHVEVSVDPTLGREEWYVEWQGKKFGSNP